MRKPRHRKTSQKDDSYLDLNLDHTANHAEKNLTFTNLTQVCRLLYCHPSFPLWTCSFPGRRCWACCFSVRSWYSVFQGPSRALHTVPHSSPQQSRSVVLGQYAVVQTQETMYLVFWTFSRRTVVDQPNYATTSDNAQGLAPSHTHSVKAEPPSQRLMPLCSQ